MTQEELNILIDKHEKWLDDRSQGKQLELNSLELKGFDISKRILINSILKNVDLSESSCEGVTFYGDSFLSCVKFCGANLKKAEFTDCEMENVDFTGANLQEAKLMGFVTAKNIKFDNAEMNKSSFIKSSMDFVSFKNASLREADFRRSHINDSSFENADLTNADMSYALLIDCNGIGANIDGAKLFDARELPENWKQKIGWYSDEQENIRRIKQHLRENPARR